MNLHLVSIDAWLLIAQSLSFLPYQDYYSCHYNITVIIW
nr:MAG TPA_asm: hypothetical protein [Caudoviricetes sp.]